MGAVIGARMIIVRVVVVIHKVPATDVICVAIAVTVGPVFGFVIVVPDIGRQILMVPVRPCVNNCHNHGRASGLGVPGFRGIQLLQAPQLAKVRIIWRQRCSPHIVRFHVLHIRVILIDFQCLLHGHPFGKF